MADLATPTPSPTLAWGPPAGSTISAAVATAATPTEEDRHMADPPRYPDTKPHTTPPWVKVFGIIAIVVVLLVLAMLLFGGGDHGPGRHTPGAEPADQIEQGAPRSDATGDHRAPPGIPDHG